MGLMVNQNVEHLKRNHLMRRLNYPKTPQILLNHQLVAQPGLTAATFAASQQLETLVAQKWPVQRLKNQSASTSKKKTDHPSHTIAAHGLTAAIYARSLVESSVLVPQSTAMRKKSQNAWP